MIEKLIAKQRGTRLKKELKSRGIKQREAAEILGMSLSGLAYNLAGERILSPVLAYAVELKLGISSEYILNGTEQREDEIVAHEITEDEFRYLFDIHLELKQLRENQISHETMKIVVDMLKDITNFLREQAKVFDRVQDYLDEEDHQIQKPEPMVS